MDKTLSKQQKACLILLKQGLTYREIGDALTLSHRTVEAYIQAIKVKTGCKKRSDLFRLSAHSPEPPAIHDEKCTDH